MAQRPKKHPDISRVRRPHLEQLEARLPLGDALLGAVLGISLGRPIPAAMEFFNGLEKGRHVHGLTGIFRQQATAPVAGSEVDEGRGARILSTTLPSVGESLKEIPGSPAIENSGVDRSSSKPGPAFLQNSVIAGTFTSSPERSTDFFPVTYRAPESGSGTSTQVVRTSAAPIGREKPVQGPILPAGLLPGVFNVGLTAQQDPLTSTNVPGAGTSLPPSTGGTTGNTPNGIGCTIILKPSEQSPQLVGDRIIWTATAINCGGNPVFQFGVGPGGNPVRVVRDFSPDNTLTWAPMQEGTYDVQVIVKDGFGAKETTSAVVSDTVDSRVTGTDPVITPTANPLVALYSMPPCTEGSAHVNFRPAGADHVQWMSTDTKPCDPGISTNFLVAGMLPNSTYEMVNVTSRGPSSPLLFTTGALPAELVFPTFNVRQKPGLGTDLSQDMVFHMAISGNTPAVNILATDLMGRINWYYDPVASGLVSTFATSLVPGGTVLLLDGGNGYGTTLREVDLAGNPLRETNVDAINAQLQALGQKPIQLLHHDAQRLPDGKTVVLAQNERTVDIKGVPRDYLGDMVIVLDQDFQVTWTWDAFDYLDVNRGPINENRSTDPVDWLHSNSVSWSPADGNLVVSVRHQDWVIKIDYANGTGNGNIVWRLGRDGDFTINSPDPYPWFSHQHDAHYIDNNTLVLFDNGNSRCAETSDCTSRGQVLVLDEKTRTVTPSLNAYLGDSSFALGSAQNLSNGNFVFTSGFLGQPPAWFGQSIELLPDGTPTYELEIESLEYRSFRMRSLYEFSNPLASPVTYFAVGGAPGHVALYKPDNTLVADFAPFGLSYTGGVSVAVADVNGDGYFDLIVGASTGIPAVRVFNGKDFATGVFNPANPDASLLVQFFPYGMTFPVGVNVAAGDVNGDGFADIVTGAASGNPDVRVYSGKDIADGIFNPNGTSLLAQFFPYALGSNIGANVAVGEVNRNGFADIVTGTTTGNPDVRVYTGKDIAYHSFNPTGASLLAQWFAYPLNLGLGATVAVGDTTGDGFGDIITGATIGNPDVRVYSGKDIAHHSFDPTGASELDQFFAYALNFNIGVTLASANFYGDGKADILTGAANGAPHYRVVRGSATGILPPALFEGFAPGIQGGIAVGA